MKILLINATDKVGGAANAALQLTKSLIEYGINAHLGVITKTSAYDFVFEVPKNKQMPRLLRSLKDKLKKLFINFFPFCENLLEKYKDDERIMQISGTNRLGLIKESTSYFFTNYPSEWGWATWKRAWDKYDYSIKQWGTKEAKDIVADMYGKYSIFLAKIFDDTFNNVDSITWWDYQWGFIKNINSGLTITPYLNQISNIGFDENATHTTDTSSKFNRLPTQELPKELIHPNYVYKTVTYDNLILDLHFKSQLDSLKPKSFTFRLKRKIKNILRKIGLWKK